MRLFKLFKERDEDVHLKEQKITKTVAVGNWCIKKSNSMTM